MNPIRQLFKTDETGQFKGVDQRGAPKIRFLKKLVEADVAELNEITERIIFRWFRIGRERNDYSWRLNACYFEYLRRNKQKIFHSLYKKKYYEKTNI
jgi:hypothetical protein